MTMISVEHFRSVTAFVQSARAGSFTLAATQLGLSKSGVAKGVARLEERLGVRLFARTTRRFALTVEGQAFYDSCVRALAEMEGAEATLQSRRLIPGGRLRVGLPVVFGRRWVLPILLDIAKRYPGMELDITLTDRVLDPVDEGIDLVIRFGEIGDSTVLIGRNLGAQTSVVCASPAYLAARGRPTSVDDLDMHSAITFGRDGRTDPWIFMDKGGKAFSKTLRGNLNLNHHAAILDAALAGHGVALLATWLTCDHLESGDLVRLPLDAEPLGFPIHVLWPESRNLAARVRIVVDDMVQCFLPHPPWEQPRPGRAP